MILNGCRFRCITMKNDQELNSFSLNVLGRELFRKYGTALGSFECSFFTPNYQSKGLRK